MALIHSGIRIRVCFSGVFSYQKVSAVCTQAIYGKKLLARVLINNYLSQVRGKKKLVLLLKNLRRKRSFLKLCVSNYYSSLRLHGCETGHRCGRISKPG